MGIFWSSADSGPVTEPPGTYVVIDVRSKGEWNGGHIDGALHMPHTEISRLIGQQVPEKDKPIKLYCASGMRANSAKSTLLSMGYTNVANLGGYSEARQKLGL